MGEDHIRTGNMLNNIRPGHLGALGVQDCFGSPRHLMRIRATSAPIVKRCNAQASDQLFRKTLFCGRLPRLVVESDQRAAGSCNFEAQLRPPRGSTQFKPPP